ncbi:MULTISPECIES: ferritin-like domain-containing protein [Hymenobacter]|uniref:Ferritin-like domain-containing protein n=1 Tax=Hymenobacter jejuensis TaxID=2502781 RepID=A0A5B8A164_9BACT|nr:MULTISPECIES: ferritin-like domain-containing protein [Hymenobacter]MBC6990750.1 ferritin-like domain-containing protein [Hymenobacter sp. BT491]QDA60847.1 ferritin-like domain-containing protein [Hymenobacter jejuensis]
MNIFQIIDKLAAVDPDVLDRFDSRRAVFNSLGSMAKRTALSATPLFLGALFQKAYAQTAAETPVQILNYALTLELLEADFYKKFLAAGTIPAGAPLGAITQIKKHEDAHVTLLTNAIKGLNGTPVTGVTFKQSAFPADYATQLVVAQALEDTGVRAYKGRAGELLGTDLLTVALQIHSVEARHAAHIRGMRQQPAWIPASDSALPAPLGPVYTGSTPESNTTQAGVEVVSALKYSADDAAAAFDEILTKAEVLDMSRAGGLVQS